jgi:hypothetical protein
MWRVREGLRDGSLLGGVEAEACGAVGIIGGDEPKGHHSRRWIQDYSLAREVRRIRGIFVFCGDIFCFLAEPGVGLVVDERELWRSDAFGERIAVSRRKPDRGNRRLFDWSE